MNNGKCRYTGTTQMNNIRNHSIYDNIRAKLDIKVNIVKNGLLNICVPL